MSHHAHLLHALQAAALPDARDLPPLRGRIFARVRAAGWSPVPSARGTPPPATTSDEALLRAHIDGDPHAFDLLFDRHAPRLTGYARKTLPRAEADDAVQDAFVVLLQKAASLLGAPPVNVAGFLFGTLRHKVLHALAREARTRAVEAAPKATSDTPDPLELLLRRTEQARVTALLVAHTSPLEQEVLARLLDDHDAATIAADLGITPGHVRVLRHRALAKLRLLLAQEAS